MIGYALLPGERGKGYSSEAIDIMVDYLFLTKNIVRIQAETHPENVVSQRVLEKAVFKKEVIIGNPSSAEGFGGTLRCSAFSEKNGKDRGYLHRDTYPYIT